MISIRKYSMIMSLFIFFIILITVACQDDKSATKKSDATGVKSGKDMGVNKLVLRKETLFDETGVSTPGAVFENFSPGGNIMFKRSFENAPPMVPHNVEAFMITKELNACTYCHMPEASKLLGATKFPKTHLSELGGEAKGEELNQIYYNCTQCHTAQADITEPVKNTFKAEFSSKEAEKSSKLTIKSEVIWGKE